jgi:hypothetical protein
MLILKIKKIILIHKKKYFKHQCLPHLQAPMPSND